MFLEEGPLSYMSEYSQRASDGRDLGTWAEFVARLSTGHRDYSPEKTARAKLKEHCAGAPEPGVPLPVHPAGKNLVGS